MSTATEQLADRAGPGIGGLLNVTFGNAPELIIAFFALQKGLQEVVKASLVGSVIGNSLLVLGGSLPNVSELSHHYDPTTQGLSGGVAGILIFSYIAGLWFSLRTHRDL